MSKPQQLAEKLFLIDDFDLNWHERTGTYVLVEEELTIIETSASPSIPYLLQGLKDLQLAPEDIKYIIVTHIHLDHAGGAGLLLQHCPNATVVVHPKGARHLADPSRLIAGAQAVYGEKFSELFDPILPIPTDRLIVMNDQDQLKIGPNCSLTFFDSPGHANHHFSIYYPSGNGIFTGDTAGVFYPQLKRDGVELYLPSTSPNQFDPEKMRESLLKFEEMNLDRIYFGHYGMSTRPNEVYSQVRMWLNIFVEAAEQAYQQHTKFETRVEATIQKILAQVSDYIQTKGIAEDHPAYEVIKLDIDICSKGLIDFLDRKSRN
ncbi:MBL fold metallo-hydrolase [Neobacillus sp. LXY-4]|uniref:MBL fold metallo-hydrolase n=1 Tax=Neobacillus sp. LXY-4 TaxID=3379826 RepID=UPI003EE1895B